MDKAKGALVGDVVPNGPAADAKIKSGDVILTFDGKEVEQMRDLPRIVAETPVEKEVEVIAAAQRQRSDTWCFRWTS